MTAKADAVPGDLSRSEPNLITRAQQGDREAFGKLYEFHHEPVASYIRCHVRFDPTLAEDLTADVFLRAWSKIGTFRWKGVSIRAWLCRIARNAVIDYHRNQATRRLIFVGDIAAVSDFWNAPDCTAEECALSALDEAELRLALGQLTPRQQEVLRLRFFQELSVTETASMFGSTTGAVKTLQYRALDSLRKAYAEVAA